MGAGVFHVTPLTQRDPASDTAARMAKTLDTRQVINRETDFCKASCARFFLGWAAPVRYGGKGLEAVFLFDFEVVMTLYKARQFSR